MALAMFHKVSESNRVLVKKKKSRSSGPSPDALRKKSGVGGVQDWAF